MSRSLVSLGELVSEATRSLAARLRGMAGLANVRDQAFENLEERRLMFALTVTADDVDPQTGLGTVDAYFGYAIPVLQTTLDDTVPQNPQADTIDFNDTPLGVVNPAGPRAFPDSILAVETNLVPTTDFTVEGIPPNNDQRFLRANLSVGEFVRYFFVSEAGNVNSTRIPVQQFSINFNIDPTAPGDASGLTTTLFQAEIVFGNGETQTVTGPALAALMPGQFQGIGNFTIADNRGIRSVAFRRIASAPGDIPSFTMDDAALIQFPGRYTALMEERIQFPAHIQLTGPVGASVVVRDLYNRDMVRTLAVGVPSGGDAGLPLIDLNDDGIPDFNDGIGSITITGNDSRTSASIYGGAIEIGTDEPDEAEFSDRVGQDFFSFTRADGLDGFHDDFEQAGFGYAVEITDNTVKVGGLAPVGGSVIIGSPFVRTNTNTLTYNPFGRPQGTVPVGDNDFAVFEGFNNAEQGIFVDSGNMGRLDLHAIVHGSSRFAGFVNELVMSYLVGSVAVKGDVGTMMLGTDAGMWSQIKDLNIGGLQPVIKTESQITVERTVGSLMVAGRNMSDVVVVGDLNSPVDRPARDSFNYYEREFVYGVANQTVDAYVQQVTNGSFIVRDGTSGSRGTETPLIWGGRPFRNDAIESAEFLATSTSGVRIQGELSGRDALNGEDVVDVFAFTARAGQQITMQATGIAGQRSAPYSRILDYRGRTLAATDLPFGDGRFQVNEIRWTPEADGVYFLALTDPLGVDGGSANNAYTVVLTGMVPTTFGEYRTGGGSGFTDVENQADNSLALLSGHMGLLRVGVGLLDGGGGVVDPTSGSNTDQDADTFTNLSGGTYTINGSLFGLHTGSDIGVDGGAANPIQVTVSGNVHQFYTGVSPEFGGNANEGDVNFFQLRVGGSIGEVRISGGIGMDQDADDPRARVSFRPGHVIFRTGESGVPGNIDTFRLGSHMVAGVLSLQTSPGSVIGQFLVSQDKYYGDRPADGRFGIYRGNRTDIFTGLGSDIIFADAPRFDLNDEVRNVFFTLRNGEALELIDDAGSRVSITLTGVLDSPLNVVRVIPIDGSQGVVIAGIDVNLGGGDASPLGGTLTISGSNSSGGAGRVGIGRITVTGANATSNLLIQGSVKVDVYQIVQTNGDAFGDVSNETPGGDIVSADLAAARNVTIRGNLGSTQGPAGHTIRGPFLGFGQGIGDEGETPLPIPAQNFFDDDFNGNAFRPVRDENFDQGNAYLDDIGGPYDGYLDGMIFRTGNVFSVSVDGSVGDVLAPAGVINSVTANNGGVTAPGGFDGITGTLFGVEIGNVNVGDGLRGTGYSPLLRAGIFALDDIGTIGSSRTTGVIFEGVVIASNSVLLQDEATQPPTPTAPPPILGEGLGTISFTGAIVRDAFFGVNLLDRFWLGYNYVDDSVGAGNIENITLSSSTFFRSRIDGDRLGNVNLAGTDFDASRITMRGNINTVLARSFRNSTLSGDEFERVDSTVTTGGNVQNLTAQEDIEDLTFDIIGSVRGSISARNISRSAIDVDNEIRGMNVSQDIRGTSINAGELATLAVARRLANSTISLSGVVRSLTAGLEIINSRIEVTGPDAALQSLSAPNRIQGSIAVSGPIGTIAVPSGDLDADITTTTARGNITSLTAGRDLAVTTDVSGTIGTLAAGRHIGSAVRRGVILSTGTIASVNIPSGQLYADVRSGQSITAATIGGAVNKPGDVQVGEGSLVAFGSIGTVTVAGDFGGDIISYSGGITAINVTNGSLLPGGTVAAYDGSIGALTITNGNLYSNVHADVAITTLTVTAGADGVFGDVGVNDALSQSTNYDARRNALPAGVFATAAVQGPRITAGQTIGTFTVTNGSLFETLIWAGQTITSININGSILKDGQTSGQASFIGAGDSIDLVTITGSASNTRFIAGIVSFGADSLPGGTSTRADVVKSGDIKVINIAGGTTGVTFTAGMTAGADGIYNTADDLQTPGTSVITTLNLGGTVTSTSAFADSLSASVQADTRLTKGGFGSTVVNTNPVTPTNPNGDPDTDLGVGTPAGTSFTGTRTFTVGSATYTITIAGPGTGFFDVATNRLTLRGTGSTTNLTIASTTTLSNFDLVTTDDGALGVLTVSSPVDGDSDFIIDGGVTTMNFRSFDGTGTIRVGGNVTTASFTALTGGFFSARSVTTFTIAGNFGAASPLVTGEASVHLLSAGAVSITGVNRGLFSIEQSATSLTQGSAERAFVRVGGNLGGFNSGTLNQFVLSVQDALGAVAINGNVTGTTIAAGLDLGTDAFFGGSGTASDELSTGSIASVTITGNFSSSSIVAGFNRGADGFFGTSDDTVAAGRSTVGPITITGTATGSTRASESFLIASSGTIGAVRAAGQVFVNVGNLSIQTPALQPESLQVEDIITATTGRVFTATIVFNQPIDFSSVSRALSVLEVRGTGNIRVRLIEGIDFTLENLPSLNSIRISFAQSVTSANQPAVPGRPGPGIYRFELNQSFMRAKVSGVLLDGSGDGLSPAGDNFSQDTIIGDAGDKFVAETINRGSGALAQRIDMYAPINLDLVFDNNLSPDGLADVNVETTIRGFIGDHPDNNSNFFRFAADVDIYSITIQAGQILRLGAMSGNASRAALTLHDATGAEINRFTSDDTISVLPTPITLDTDITFPQVYLIKQTGTYFISVSNVGVAAPGELPDVISAAGGTGDYSFTIELFDDGDSGFTSNTDAGDGEVVVDPPAPISFAGPDGQFNTADDVTRIVVGEYTFDYSRGADNTPNTADDVITGGNGSNVTLTRDGAGNITRTIQAAIGAPGHAGVPGEITADVDIFHLNGRSPIAPGTKMRATMVLAELGANLGGVSPVVGLDNDLRGDVQLALFDTSGSTGFGDATLVFSPTDFSPVGGRPNTVIASNESMQYGFDATGDFFIEFIVPERLGGSGAGSFAFYVQGVYNTDYTLRIDTIGTGAITRTRQNVLVEIEGGSINWLEVANTVTNLGAFDPSTLGFTGSINGVSMRDYIANGIVSTLNSIYQSAGFDVFFATSTSDFEFQPYSTVYITSTVDTVGPIFDNFSGLNFLGLGGNFFSTQPFGFSEHSDPFNIDPNDEAVVFIPSFALQGFGGSVSDADELIISLSAAAGRRVGELLGLRITDPNVAAGEADVQASNSPSVPDNYVISATLRRLSGPTDSIDRTNFYLGQQNARSLLDRILT